MIRNRSRGLRKIRCIHTRATTIQNTTASPITAGRSSPSHAPHEIIQDIYPHSVNTEAQSSSRDRNHRDMQARQPYSVGAGPATSSFREQLSLAKFSEGTSTNPFEESDMPTSTSGNPATTTSQKELIDAGPTISSSREELSFPASSEGQSTNLSEGSDSFHFAAEQSPIYEDLLVAYNNVQRSSACVGNFEDGVTFGIPVLPPVAVANIPAMSSWLSGRKAS